jgi:hypothetical protein
MATFPRDVKPIEGDTLEYCYCTMVKEAEDLPAI